MRIRFACPALLLFLLPAASRSSDAPRLGPFDALISIVEDADVPAQEMGMLRELTVREGVLVESGDVLGRVDDSAARVDLDRARIDLELATHQFENDLQVQLAQKALGVAGAELQRALDANDQKANTVSATEMQRLQFLRDKAELEVEQAVRNQREAELTVQQMQTDLSLAELAVQRRAIVAPIGGRIVEIRRQRGEWVQPGETVLRIINTQRVFAEALLTIDEIPHDVTGHPVQITFSREGRPGDTFGGTIVFVDPRINAVNGEYIVRAEIENPDRVLRPGDHAQMTILPGQQSATEMP